MQITKIISSATVERLKQKARKLKREKPITHTQALDEVAVSAGFNHWHQVVQAND
ncbi:TPA: plasmid-related protein, partial [Vibrio cholerae]|nr:plasmid-related protein [Vibrio cholerae]